MSSMPPPPIPHASRIKQFIKGYESLLGRTSGLDKEESSQLLRLAFESWNAACVEHLNINLLDTIAPLRQTAKGIDLHLQQNMLGSLSTSGFDPSAISSKSASIDSGVRYESMHPTTLPRPFEATLAPKSLNDLSNNQLSERGSTRITTTSVMGFAYDGLAHQAASPLRSKHAASCVDNTRDWSCVCLNDSFEAPRPLRKDSAVSLEAPNHAQYHTDRSTRFSETCEAQDVVMSDIAQKDSYTQLPAKESTIVAPIATISLDGVSMSNSLPSDVLSRAAYAMLARPEVLVPSILAGETPGSSRGHSDGSGKISATGTVVCFKHLDGSPAALFSSSSSSKAVLVTYPPNVKAASKIEGNSIVDQDSTATPAEEHRKRKSTLLDSIEDASSAMPTVKKRKTVKNDNRPLVGTADTSVSKISKGLILRNGLVKASLQAAKKFRKENASISSAIDEDHIAKVVIYIMDAFGTEGAQLIRELVAKPANWSSGAVRQFQQGLREAKTQLAQMVNAYRTFRMVDTSEPLGNWLNLVSLALLTRKHTRAVTEMENPDSITRKLIEASGIHGDGLTVLNNTALINRYLLKEIDASGTKDDKVTANKIKDHLIAGRVVNLYEAKFGRGLFALLSIKPVWRRIPKDVHRGVAEAVARDERLVSICKAVYDNIIMPLLDQRNTGVAEMQRIMRSWDGKLASLERLFEKEDRRG